MGVKHEVGVQVFKISEKRRNKALHYDLRQGQKHDGMLMHVCVSVP